jgi:hypothetical protein
MDFKDFINTNLPFVKENEYYFQVYSKYEIVYLMQIIKIGHKRVVIKRVYFDKYLKDEILMYNFRRLTSPYGKQTYIQTLDNLEYFFKRYDIYKLNQFDYDSKRSYKINWRYT